MNVLVGKTPTCSDNEKAMSGEEKEGKPQHVEPRKLKTVNGNKVYKDFKNLVQKIGNVKAAIFSHACPDPDAVSSMMGVQWILEKAFHIESALFYGGEISHPQNGSMCNLLNPDLRRVNEEYKPEDYGLRILVDTVPDHAGVGRFADTKFDVVIDHHRDIPHDYEGLLIHKKAGSCAAIVYDMAKEVVDPADWFDDEVDADQKVATALIAGIMTDTNFMLSDDCTEYERVAFNELFEHRNGAFLHQIVFFKRRKFWVDRKADAVADAKIDGEGIAIVGLGLIPEKERDLIADMASEMVTWASVETAIAFAVVGGDRIEASVRSLNASLNVSDFCKKLGGKHGSGGGKQGKGAYMLSLAGSSIDPDEDDSDQLAAWEFIKKRETSRIMRIIRK